MKSSCDASNVTCRTVRFPLPVGGSLEKSRKQTGNSKTNERSTVYSLILATQRCTVHDSGKFHSKNAIVTVSLPAVAVDLEDAAVDDNSSDAVAVMLLSLLSSFLFLLPVFFLHSKKARRHAKSWERFRG